MTRDKIVGAGAIIAFLAVAAGAFASHALRGDARAADLLETASQYAFWHALALLACAALGRTGRVVPALFIGGTALFSGSLTLLALGAPPWLGAVTPFGGTAFLAGWAVLAIQASRGDRIAVGGSTSGGVAPVSGGGSAAPRRDPPPP